MLNDLRAKGATICEVNQETDDGVGHDPAGMTMVLDRNEALTRRIAVRMVQRAHDERGASSSLNFFVITKGKPPRELRTDWSRDEGRIHAKTFFHTAVAAAEDWVTASLLAGYTVGYIVRVTRWWRGLRTARSLKDGDYPVELRIIDGDGSDLPPAA